MCLTRVVFCRHRGCYNTVGELILEPCQGATSAGTASSGTTPIQGFRQLDSDHATSDGGRAGCTGLVDVVEEGRGSGGSRGKIGDVDEWLAVSRAFLFGCGSMEPVQRHRCGYRVCASCFLQDMDVSVRGLRENGTGGEGEAKTLLARRQDLSVARLDRTLEGVDEWPAEHGWAECPAMLGDDELWGAEGSGYDVDAAGLGYYNNEGGAYDLPVPDDVYYETLPGHLPLPEEQLYPPEDFYNCQPENLHYYQPGDTHYQPEDAHYYQLMDHHYHQGADLGLQAVSLAEEDKPTFAIDPQLLGCQSTRTVSPGLPTEEQQQQQESEAGPACAARSPVEDGEGGATGAQAVETGEEGAAELTHAVPCEGSDDVGNQKWEQGVGWGPTGYYYA